MTEVEPPAYFALDQPGSAGPSTRRYAFAALAAMAAAASVVVLFPRVELTPFPQFSTFYAIFLFVVNGVVAFLLFGQFAHRRLMFYAILGAAYCFNALIAIPFFLTFPGAVQAGQLLVGGTQSSIWVWHAWHILFPLFVVLALLVHARRDERAPGPQRIAATIAWSVVAAVALVVAIAIVVTAFHEALPILITTQRVPLTDSFYVVGGVATVCTGVALGLAAWSARCRSILHIWLAIVLVAYMGDVVASLAAFARYTVGWYVSRIGSMLAATLLLVVLLNEINRLYYRLGAAHRELQERENSIRHLAYFDPVTDLPNRRLLMDRLKQDLAQARRYGYALALLFLDLDKFKQVNDRLGHEAGDKLLREVGERVTRCVRSGDTVSRLGGDEFVIVLPEIAHVRDAEATAQKIIAALSDPMYLDEEPIVITASIGIAVVTGDSGADANTLLARADAAMYCAKNGGRNQYVLED